MSDPILLDVADGVADLRLHRPEAMNAMDLDLVRALRDAAAQIRDRDDVRVVKVSSEGRMFCAGGDLGWMQTQPDGEAALRELAGTLHEALLTLATQPAPVVARVHGAAAGAGFSLVMGADFAIAAEAASFTMAYTGVGLSPDGGSSWLLPRLVGHRRATEIMITNRRVDAAEALALGLVTEVAAADALDERVDALVAQLAAGATASFGAVKALLRRSATADFADQLAAETDSIARLGGSPTGAEGIGAFLEKRAPSFPAR